MLADLLVQGEPGDPGIVGQKGERGLRGRGGKKVKNMPHVMCIDCSIPVEVVLFLIFSHFLYSFFIICYLSPF